jgi:hypothetical protein
MFCCYWGRLNRRQGLPTVLCRFVSSSGLGLSLSGAFICLQPQYFSIKAVSAIAYLYLNKVLGARI